ncbi:uncharacterized protein B0P05DRAFT_458710, partial [Gilbertella persicaria]|uniref:uncharacterized protein n=1 Tax=Gilbertella persicaria TaxID=101096 RepID=UPI00221F65FB
LVYYTCIEAMFQKFSGRGNARYVNGMGCDIYNQERLVMESSGGSIKENIQHTSNDTLKQMHSSIGILNSDITHKMASFIIMKKSLAIRIRLVK